jgi:hypothetical protein
MSEKFRYNFDKRTGIMYKYYYEAITIEDISSSWDYAINNNIIPKETTGFILDYRKANLNIKLTEYNKIAEYYYQHLDIFRDKKIAIIVQKPKDVIISDLVESKDLGYTSRPFYTVEAAINWILE